MHDLAALTPLGAAAPRTDRVGAISVTEVTDRAIASVSTRNGKAKPFATAAKALFGIDLPAPGQSAAGPVWTLIWTGPDQWFAEAPFATHEDIAAIAKDALGDTASVTEQTDGWVRFDIEGPTAVDMMERLCPLPARRMKTGAASRSIIEHMGSLVICRAEGRHFSVIAPRSFAGSMHHALMASARSIA
ncbi:sarcosine oxidase subunit gamma [Defluviimonas denitrificans]|uniref:Sarcosine oxidase subunit gamma n=1 Tax=Albidovulum denitrificans TaxID=404881 RepID=A0A2S8S7P3_9RHOB|nr:sarcosine oxidase subunit gamma [Defluviimonas denitrificans]PQV56804.1 sarcosine oxidase subunit gamma [Defluviimonas denitrificans]